MYRGEYFNSISHLVGAVGALAGLVVLVVLAVQVGDPWKIVSFSVYGVTLLLLFVTSTLYHSLKGRAKEVFRLLDYHAIYLLIAGTYTPFTLITLRDSGGWWIFSLVWGLAVIGIVLDIFTHRGNRIIQLLIYLIMGWIVLVALKPLLNELSGWGFTWLLCGGLLFTIGVVFFVFDQKVKHFHGIWHLFVLAGAAMHYLTILLFVL